MLRFTPDSAGLKRKRPQPAWPSRWSGKKTGRGSRPVFIPGGSDALRWATRADCALIGGPGAAVGGWDRFDPDRRRSMPRAYSTDLRGRALAACEAGEGRQSEIARVYRIGERTLSAWLRTAREEGRRAPRPRRGGTRPVGGGRRARDAGRPGGGAERRDARRVRRPAGRAHGRAAQPLGPVPGAPGARPGAEEKTLQAAERDREDVAEAGG